MSADENYCGLGHQHLSQWFGLSYASFATLPRILMEAMPDEWQGRMAVLLFEYEASYPVQDHLPGTRVQAVRDGKLVSFPPWLLHYRHPDREEIARLRPTPDTEGKT